MKRRSLTASCGAFAIALLLSACGPNKNDFGSLEQGASPANRYRDGLELPPDLVDTSSESILAASAEPEPEVKVLPEINNLEIEQNNDEGWIEVNVDPDTVWKKLVSHWNSLGIDLVDSDPTTGIMVTDWVVPRSSEELRRREFLGSDFLGNVLDELFGGLFDQATTLDKYTVQLERKPDAHTRINVTHRGLVKIQTQQPTKKDNEKFEWVETEEQPEKVKRALTSIAYGLSGGTS